MSPWCCFRRLAACSGFDAHLQLHGFGNEVVRTISISNLVILRVERDAEMPLHPAYQRR